MRKLHLLLWDSFGSDGTQANVSHSAIGQPRELMYCCVAGIDWGRWLGLGTVEAEEDDHVTELRNLGAIVLLPSLSLSLWG